jgi:NCAIR mutase (PurE)-related protein
MCLGVNDEAIVTKAPSLRRAAGQVRQVDSAGRELLQDRNQASGLIRSLINDQRCSIVAGRRRNTLAGDQHKPRLIVFVVGDVGGDHRETVDIGGKTRGECHDVISVAFTDDASRIDGAVGRSNLGVGKTLAEKTMTLRSGHRDGVDRRHLIEFHTWATEQAVFDVDHDLSGDDQFVIESQGILREVDHTLDRVFDGHEAHLDLAPVDGVQHIGGRPVCDVLGVGEIVQGHERLVGECPEGAEEPDTSRHSGQGSAASQTTRRTIADVAAKTAATKSAHPCHDERVDESTLRSLMDDVRTGATTPDDAIKQLRRLPFADIEGASIDHHRHLRQGMPEAVYGPGKRPEQCVAIVGELLTNGTGPVLLTRADEEQRVACTTAHGGSIEEGRALLWRAPTANRAANVVIVTAGTSDLPVANEAALTLRAYGLASSVVADVGVAGLHRLLARLDQITSADAVIVIAGMEGALASVVGGLTGAPVVAVPTSVGYGAALDGVTALLAMHASCASGVTVVGIDNGFGAACAIARILP